MHRQRRYRSALETPASANKSDGWLAGASPANLAELALTQTPSKATARSLSNVYAAALSSRRRHQIDRSIDRSTDRLHRISTVVQPDPEPDVDRDKIAIRNMRSKYRCSCVLQFTL